jgi:hypothetical protein
MDQQLDFENCFKSPRHNRPLLDFETWYELNKGELQFIWTSGYCYDLDADWDVWVEHRYECYRADLNVDERLLLPIRS